VNLLFLWVIYWIGGVWGFLRSSRVVVRFFCYGGRRSFGLGGSCVLGLDIVCGARGCFLLGFGWGFFVVRFFGVCSYDLLCVLGG